LIHGNDRTGPVVDPKSPLAADARIQIGTRRERCPLGQILNRKAVAPLLQDEHLPQFPWLRVRCRPRWTAFVERSRMKHRGRIPWVDTHHRDQANLRNQPRGTNFTDYLHRCAPGSNVSRSPISASSAPDGSASSPAGADQAEMPGRQWTRRRLGSSTLRNSVRDRPIDGRLGDAK